MEWIADPSIWAGLVTLVVIELVLGIDNLVFIATPRRKLPPAQRDRARITGLLLAMVMRLLLLASISWLVTLTKPLIVFHDFSFSARDFNYARSAACSCCLKPPSSLMNGWRGKTAIIPPSAEGRNSGPWWHRLWCSTPSSRSTR